MTRDYRLKVSLSKRMEDISMHTSFTDKDGNPLSRANAKTAERLLECWYRMCYDVLSSVCSVGRSYDVCCSWLSKQPQVINIAEWVGSLELLAERFIHSRPFNLEGTTPMTAWLKVLFRSKYIRLMVPRRDLFSLLRFPKRLTLVNAEDLETATEEAFFENVSRVNELNEAMQFSSEEIPWIESWLQNYQSPDLWDCHHSGGSTADPQVKNDICGKYAMMVEDPYTWEFCRMARINPITLHSGQFLSTTLLEQYKDGLRYKPMFGDGAYVPSRLQFVPKSYKTYRSVAMESEIRMFYQNGVKTKLVECMNSKLLRNIDLEDQERSRELALEASNSRAYATIDFSMASDSVSYGAFKYWFGNTKFGQQAATLRARSFEYKGVEHDNPIAFTMGSPLCFPVECLVFLAMAYATVAEQGDDPRKAHILVYGDDVILPSKYAEAFMRRAERNGFLPNWDKSYWQKDIAFREACGMEAINGEDITPLYIPRGFKGNLQESKSSYIHLANAAYGRGYFGLRKKLLYWLTTDRLACLVPRKSTRGRVKYSGLRKTYKSWVTYSDDISVLTNESSTVVFDPDADRLNKPHILYRAAPYKYGGRKIIQSYLAVPETITLPDKGKDFWSEEVRAEANLDFALHYKPNGNIGSKYAARSTIAKLLANEPFIWIPKPHRGFGQTVTRMAITIRPYVR